MGKIFKRGLIALAPVAISIAIVIWLLKTLEEIFRVPVEWLLGDYYFPGVGLLVAVIFIFIVGIIINNFLIQKITAAVDRLFARIPLFKTIYNSIGDMKGCSCGDGFDAFCGNFDPGRPFRSSRGICTGR
jgi:uncharacterized membrane protein